MPRYPKYFGPVYVPEGVSGNWSVEKFSISDEEASWNNAIATFSSSRRDVEPGNYTRLMGPNQFDNPIMSDTPTEAWDHYKFVCQAKGHVLINGLGLGFVLRAILNKPEVEHVTVIEISPNVIDLVAPYYSPNYEDSRVTIIQADALEWRPPKNVRFGAVWHDIWPSICSDNLPDMHKLHRRYGRKADWQGSWSRDLL